TAGDWLVDQLHLALARSDLAVLAQAVTAWRAGDQPTLTRLDAWVRSSRETSELRQQTEQMGRSLLVWLRLREVDDPRLALLAGLKPAPAWPVAFALALAQSGAPLAESLQCFAFGWAENMVQAAIKAVPLGQNAGQRMLARLMLDIPAATAQATTLADADRQAFSPMLAILSAQHETQYSRLFRS
ncbi:MAG: ureF, partial [Pseudomonas sp.]|nr:ureF [Pseudomonas sp.]